jgi:hypothetical protein
LETLLRKLARGLLTFARRAQQIVHRNHPWKIKGPDLRQLIAVRQDPAHAISTKNKHLLLACATNPRFHGGCFGVLGHTSSEALKM